jgi:hypothetical protein
MGSGVQTRNDGIRIKCPSCNGTGLWEIAHKIEITCKNEYPLDDMFSRRI